MLTKKQRFFGARSPSKLVYIGAKGAFRKILGSVGQKGISEKVSKGGPFGSAGDRMFDFFQLFVGYCPQFREK